MISIKASSCTYRSRLVYTEKCRPWLVVGGGDGGVVVVGGGGGVVVVVGGGGGVGVVVVGVGGVYGGVYGCA